MRIAKFICLLLVISLLFQSFQHAKADFFDEIGKVAEGVAGAIGALFSKALGVNASLEELENTIKVASGEVQETVIVASNEGQKIIRVAGTTANDVIDNASLEGQEFVIVASAEGQQVIRTGGQEARSIISTVGAESRQTLETAVDGGSEIILLGSKEIQAIERVAGDEIRETLERMSQEAEELIIIASSEIQTVVELVGDEARRTFTAAADEAIRVLDEFHDNNVEMMNIIEEKYQGNLDITIDQLDNGSQRILRNWEASLYETNKLFQSDILLVETSSIRVIDETQKNFSETINNFQAAQEDIIVVATTAAVFFIDRATNNMIMLVSLFMLGIGLLLFIYLFYVHVDPKGKTPYIAGGVMFLYAAGFLIMLLSPEMRLYVMRSAQIGIEKEVERSQKPEISLYKPSMPQGIGWLPAYGLKLVSEGKPLTTIKSLPTITPTTAATPLPVANTPVPVAKIVVDIQKANVRSGPGTGYSTIGGAAFGETFIVTGRTNGLNLNWLQIDYNGRKGWIREDLVSIQESGPVPILTVEHIAASTPTSIPTATNTPSPKPTSTFIPSINKPAPTPTAVPTATPYYYPPARGSSIMGISLLIIYFGLLYRKRRSHSL